MNKAAFLDRDGVIFEKAPADQYITCWEEVRFLPRVEEGIVLLNRAGFRLIVVSNQRCVAKGLVTMAAVEDMHGRMCRSLARAGARIDAVYYCPHEKYPPCECRKPQPGMLLKAARIHGIDLGQSWMVGDSDSDVEAGKSAGCKTVRLVQPGEAARGGADLFASSLRDAARFILAGHIFVRPDLEGTSRFPRHTQTYPRWRQGRRPGAATFEQEGDL
jgi:histidinol-phosphate phosphatase family protein